MWFLYAIQDGLEITRTLLRPGKMYTLGRKDADILPPIIEKTISRKHATLNIEQNTEENWNEFDGKPYVLFHDLHSHCGSYINSTRVQGVSLEQGVYMKDGDILQIGSKTGLFRLTWKPLTICRQAMPASAKQKLADSVRTIGAKVTPFIQSPYTHLLMPSIKISFKVAYCLAEGKPIVSQKWLDALMDLPDNDYTFPPVVDYLPPLDASCNGPHGVPDFTPNQERSRLFTGKRIVFFEDDQYEQLSSLVEACNGESVLLRVDETDPFEEQLEGENSIVIESVKLRQSLAGQNIVNALESFQKRIVHDTDLCWAILYCSMDIQRNAKFDIPLTLPTFPDELDNAPNRNSASSSTARVPSNANLLRPSSITASSSSSNVNLLLPSPTPESSPSTKQRHLPQVYQTSYQVSSRPSEEKDFDLDGLFDQIVGDEPSRPPPTVKNTSPESIICQTPDTIINHNGSDCQNSNVMSSDEMTIEGQATSEQPNSTKMSIDRKGKGRMHEPMFPAENDEILPADNEDEPLTTGRKSKKPRTGKNTNITSLSPAPRKSFILPELEKENDNITAGGNYTKVVYTALVVAPSPPENWIAQQRRQQVSGEINYKNFKKATHIPPIDPFCTVEMMNAISSNAEGNDPLPVMDDDDFADIRIMSNPTRGTMRL